MDFHLFLQLLKRNLSEGKKAINKLFGQSDTIFFYIICIGRQQTIRNRLIYNRIEQCTVGCIIGQITSTKQHDMCEHRDVTNSKKQKLAI